MDFKTISITEIPVPKKANPVDEKGLAEMLTRLSGLRVGESVNVAFPFPPYNYQDNSYDWELINERFKAIRSLARKAATILNGSVDVKRKNNLAIIRLISKRAN